jgi:hypothetical protein
MCRMRRVHISKLWLMAQYVEQKKSAQQIADENHYTLRVILSRLKEYGIPIRSAAEQTMLRNSPPNADQTYRNKDWLFDQYVTQRKHMAQIAREIGCDNSIIGSWLTRFEIPHREQIGENCHNWKGGSPHIPYMENKNCSNYLGRYIAETVLSNYFEDVQRMPYGHQGYDFICKKGYKIDVKSSCLYDIPHGNPAWHFDISRNKKADYFLCIGFDTREDLNPLRLWLVPGPVINDKITFGITNAPKIIAKWSQYEKPLDKVLECCVAFKESSVTS